MKFYTPRLSFFIIFLPITFFLSNLVFGQEQQEETYSISLVQTAEVDQDIREVDDKKVLTETYTVTKGDHLWQLFRNRGMLEKRSLPELIAILKRLNKTLTNLDLIYPGDQIIIPLTLLPVTSKAGHPKPGPEETIPLEDLKKINLENYTVKRGDSLVKVIKSRYDIPPEELHKKYLEMVRRLNPTIEDLDTIFPGQVIRLPIYSPQIVKVPILTPARPPSKETASESDLSTLGRNLGVVFGEMGEEWIQTGKHFIPLKSGGQINLNAESYPIINLVNGNRVIVDMYHLLPDKMTTLITSNWDNYKIVHLTEGDDLKKALGKILPACDYHRIYPPGGAMEVEGDIQILITADWIIEPDAAQSGNRRRVVAITVTDNHNANTPPEIKNYLKRLGITVIDYPSVNEMPPEPEGKPDLLSVGISKPTLIEKLLNLSGYPFRRGVEIPVYQSNKTDFNLIIRADFLLQKDGADSIIDLTGLGPDVLSLLKEHQFRILPLGEVNDPSMAVSKTLDFLEVKADSKHHPFIAAERDSMRNIKLIIPGIIFQDQKGQTIFATELSLPPEVIVFLSKKGYRVLNLSFS